jgi:uncharacterized cupredoxin-like copper-binding protein
MGWSMRKLGWALMAVVVLGSSALVAATGHGGVSDERVQVRIEMGEFYFQVEGQERDAPIVLKAGQRYELLFVNVGMMEHEVLIGRDVVVEDGIPDGYEVNLLDALRVDVVGDGWEVVTTGFVEVELQPGTSVALHVTLSDDAIGTWEIGCFVPGHYQAGMHAPVIVE